MRSRVAHTITSVLCLALNGGFRSIFLVQEYSELSIHTGVRSRSDQEG